MSDAIRYCPKCGRLHSGECENNRRQPEPFRRRSLSYQPTDWDELDYAEGRCLGDDAD